MSEQQTPQTPESWVGKQVMVARSSSTEAELVSLEGMNDWGVTCVYQSAEVSEPVLIPWGSLSWIRLAVEEEVQSFSEDSNDSRDSNESEDSNE